MFARASVSHSGFLHLCYPRKFTWPLEGAFLRSCAACPEC